jgi:hypothetical protein
VGARAGQGRGAVGLGRGWEGGGRGAKGKHSRPSLPPLTAWLSLFFP